MRVISRAQCALPFSDAADEDAGDDPFDDDVDDDACAVTIVPLADRFGA